MLRKFAKDYRVKLFVQKLIALIPGKLGFYLNEQVVRLARGKQGDGFANMRFKKGLNNINRLQEHGFNFDGASILELGTGWHAIDLVLFYLFGSRRIFTIDHNLHLSVESLKHVLNTLIVDKELLAMLKSSSHSKIHEERLTNLHHLLVNGFDISMFCDTINCKFYNRKSCLIIGIDEIKDIDLFYSESVLQRIPGRDLRSNLNHIVKQVMNDGAFSFHRTDQKDINAQEHVDNSLWKFEYLKYSKFSWNLISCRFNFQNRWRESDFANAFTQAGLNELQLISDYDKSDIEKLKNFAIDEEFRSYDVIDVVTSSSIFIGQK